LDIRVAAIVLTLNEEARLPITLPWIAKYADLTYVLDGGSTDGTLEIAEKHVDRVMIRPATGDIGGDRNFAASQIPADYNWILMADADEKFDQTFLEVMKRVPLQKTVLEGGPLAPCDVDAFKLPRINLPDARNFPDYQVRFYKNTPEIRWVGKIHETLYRGGTRVDRVSCLPLDLYPIIHLKRRQDVERAWW